MKICFLAGANSVHSYRWVKYFAEKGHDVHWISLVSSDFTEIRNVTLYEMGGGPVPKALNVLYFTVKTWGLIRNIKPDILHSHYAGSYGLIGALSGFHPFVLTAWGSDILFAGKSKIKGPFVKYVLSNADLITCDAYHMVEAMINLGAKREKIQLIYFGIDINKFRPGEKNDELKNRFNIPKNSPVTISLRNLEPEYDVGSLIYAIPQVIKEVPNAAFVIAGTGSQEGYLKTLAESLGISKNIRFIGKYSNDDLPHYLLGADIYVSTSLYDAGIAASTAEAMACGLPVVITNSGENDKWIEDGENGFIVPVSSPKVLAEKTIVLLKNNDLRRKFGDNGRKIIEEKNNYYREMEKMEEFYRELING